ncbi:hypothetical protein ACSBR1_000215 [Camellia fascicularis]
MNRRRLEAPPNDKPYFVAPHLYFENPPPSSSKLSLTQIFHSPALSRFFSRAIAISKFLRPNLSVAVWLQSRSFSERLQFRSSILSTAVYNLRKTNQILQNLFQLRDFEVRFGTLRLLQSECNSHRHYVVHRHSQTVQCFDPDDSMAIFMAFQSPQLEVLGLTTIFGNVTTEDATRNVLLLGVLPIWLNRNKLKFTKNANFSHSA